ncbi:hypothetical protein D9Q98_008951 [Chlorella vulgaris]|uniref:Uncharacterized protein n=1 Tax=Chlorella vulgaris TaxID=3077 RepID=A0A9D4YTF2_CHLVU|nr:hypothetical protein D9Q98_008951 [Chlorella vulgaris]
MEPNRPPPPSSPRRHGFSKLASKLGLMKGKKGKGEAGSGGSPTPQSPSAPPTAETPLETVAVPGFGSVPFAPATPAMQPVPAPVTVQPVAATPLEEGLFGQRFHAGPGAVEAGSPHSPHRRQAMSELESTRERLAQLRAAASHRAGQAATQYTSVPAAATGSPTTPQQQEQPGGRVDAVALPPDAFAPPATPLGDARSLLPAAQAAGPAAAAASRAEEGRVMEAPQYPQSAGDEASAGRLVQQPPLAGPATPASTAAPQPLSVPSTAYASAARPQAPAGAPPGIPTPIPAGATQLATAGQPLVSVGGAADQLQAEGEADTTTADFSTRLPHMTRSEAQTAAQHVSIEGQPHRLSADVSLGQQLAAADVAAGRQAATDAGAAAAAPAAEREALQLPAQRVTVLPVAGQQQERGAPAGPSSIARHPGGGDGEARRAAVPSTAFTRGTSGAQMPGKEASGEADVWSQQVLHGPSASEGPEPTASPGGPPPAASEPPSPLVTLAPDVAAATERGVRTTGEEASSSGEGEHRRHFEPEQLQGEDQVQQELQHGRVAASTVGNEGGSPVIAPAEESQVGGIEASGQQEEQQLFSLPSDAELQLALQTAPQPGRQPAPDESGGQATATVETGPARPGEDRCQATAVAPVTATAHGAANEAAAAGTAAKETVTADLEKAGETAAELKAAPGEKGAGPVGTARVSAQRVLNAASGAAGAAAATAAAGAQAASEAFGAALAGAPDVVGGVEFPGAEEEEEEGQEGMAGEQEVQREEGKEQGSKAGEEVVAEEYVAAVEGEAAAGGDLEAGPRKGAGEEGEVEAEAGAGAGGGPEAETGPREAELEAETLAQAEAPAEGAEEAEQGQGLAASLLGAAAHAVHAVQEQLHSVLEHGRQLAAEHDAAASEGQAGGRSVTGAAEASELEGERGEEGEDRRPEEQEKEGAVEGAAAGQEGAAASAPPPHTMKEAVEQEEGQEVTGSLIQTLGGTKEQGSPSPTPSPAATTDACIPSNAPAVQPSSSAPGAGLPAVLPVQATGADAQTVWEAVQHSVAVDASLAAEQGAPEAGEAELAAAGLAQPESLDATSEYLAERRRAASTAGSHGQQQEEEEGIGQRAAGLEEQAGRLTFKDLSGLPAASGPRYAPAEAGAGSGGGVATASSTAAPADGRGAGTAGSGERAELATGPGESIAEESELEGEGGGFEAEVQGSEQYTKEEGEPCGQASVPKLATQEPATETHAPTLAVAEGKPKQAHLAQQVSVGGLKEPPPSPTAASSRTTSFEAGGGGGDDLAEGASAAAQDVSSGGADTGAGPSLLGGRKPPVRLETGTTEGSEVGEDAAAVEDLGLQAISPAERMMLLITAGWAWARQRPAFTAGLVAMVPLLWAALGNGADAVFGEFGPLLLLSGAMALAATTIARAMGWGRIRRDELQMIPEQPPAPGGAAASGQGVDAPEAETSSCDSTEEAWQEASGEDEGLLQKARHAVEKAAKGALASVQPGGEQVGEVVQETESVQEAAPGTGPGPSQLPLVTGHLEGQAGRESGYESDSEGPGPVLEGVHPAHQPPGSHTEEEAAGEGRRWDSSGEEISAAVQPSLAGEQHPSLLTKAAVVGGQLASRTVGALRHAAAKMTGSAPEQQPAEQRLQDLQRSIAEMEAERVGKRAPRAAIDASMLPEQTPAVGSQQPAPVARQSEGMEAAAPVDPFSSKAAVDGGQKNSGKDAGPVEKARHAVKEAAEGALAAVQPGGEQVGEVVQETESGDEETDEVVGEDPVQAVVGAVTGAAKAVAHTAQSLADRAYQALAMEYPAADVEGEGAAVKDFAEGERETAELAASLAGQGGQGSAQPVPSTTGPGPSQLPLVAGHQEGQAGRESGYDSDSEGPGPVLEGVHPVHQPPGSRIGRVLKKAIGKGTEKEVPADVQPSLAGSAPEQQSAEKRLQDLHSSIVEMEADRFRDVAPGSNQLDM